MGIAVQHPKRSTGLRPLFVLSMWRSGSSLLYALLNQHSQIALMYEGDLPHLRHYLRGSFKAGGWRERWEFWNQGPSRHGIELDSMPVGTKDVWEATRLVYQSVARSKGATIWGEKSPHWYDDPLRIASKFPDAHFIFLWRDVNAVMESIVRAAEGERFFRKPGFMQRVLLGSENLRNACDVLRAQGRSVLEVNYEDLTSGTVLTMRQICEFLQIPFEADIASLQGADRSAIAEGRHHTLVRGDKVITTRRQSPALSEKSKAKLARYVCRWKVRSEGKWPKYPRGVLAATQAPSVLERCWDRFIYDTLLCSDRVVKLTYAVVPLSFARSLRAWIRQRSYAGEAMSSTQAQGKLLTSPEEARNMNALMNAPFAISSRAEATEVASRPLFVLSVFRSGSTLLYALLNQHSQISLLYEADLPRLSLFLWRQFRDGGWRQRWEFWNQGASRHGIPLESLPENVSDVWEATRIVYRGVARRKGATIWGEKTPRWYDSPFRRAEKFPDARFIFLWRDLHGVIGSINRAATTERSFGKAGLAREILLGTERLKEACEELKARGRSVYEVNYEDLISDTTGCMQGICKFLEIPFEPRMTSLEGADRSAICPGECHTLVKKDKIVDQRKKQEALSPEMRGKIERYISRWRRRYGQWPKYPAEIPRNLQPPAFFELWHDRFADGFRILQENMMVVLLHQIRPLVFPKKYVRTKKVVASAAEI